MSNWPVKKLGDCLVQFDRGISWSHKDEGGTIAVLRIPNIQEGQINLDDLKYIDPKSENGELDKNDIVMVASNGNPDLVGRSALVTEKEKGMRFASFLVRLRIDNTKLLSHYAHLFLLTPTFKRELRRKIATTSGIYNLKKEHIEKIKISLPPLTTQTQIVEQLDKIAEAQKLNDDLIQKSAELFQSLLHQELNPAGPADAKAMAGKKDWEVKKLGDIIIDTTNGFASRPVVEGVGQLRPNNIGSEGTLNFSSVKFVPQNYRNIKNYLLKRGDILFNNTNSVELVGKTTFIDADYDYVFSNHMTRIRTKEDAVLSQFLAILLQYFYSLGRFRFLCTPWVNQAAVNSTALKKLKIPLPSLKVQKQIVAKLSAVQEYKTQLLAQKSKLKELFNSVLAKSFSEKSVK